MRKILAPLVASSLLLLYTGYVLAVLWGWFVQPLGAPNLTMPAAIGLDLFATVLTMRTPSRQELADYSVGERFWTNVSAVSLLFLAGFILQLFVG